MTAKYPSDRWYVIYVVPDENYEERVTSAIGSRVKAEAHADTLLKNFGCINVRIVHEV